MPFDASGTRTATRPTVHNHAVTAWLFLLCAMLLVMVVLGGTTRLTGSGLSIMEWAPLRGALPPLTHAAWAHLFALYRTIPQYRLEHAGMDLAGFKQIFWLEWTHRLWGRLMGIALIVPLLWFAATRRVSRPLAWRLSALFVLGALQGAVGWFMVASGFMAGSTSVSAYRLVVHLGLALILYGTMLWTALGQVTFPAPTRTKALRLLALALTFCIALTMLAGGFVAGLHAGLTYNTFPLMDGRLVPAAYTAQPFPRGWFENIAAVQFDHRLLATLSACLALATVAAGWRAAALRPVLAALLGLVGLQYTLGVLTLLLVVPVPLAAAHQACAMLVLSAALILLKASKARGSAPGSRQGPVSLDPCGSGGAAPSGGLGATPPTYACTILPQA